MSTTSEPAKENPLAKHIHQQIDQAQGVLVLKVNLGEISKLALCEPPSDPALRGKTFEILADLPKFEILRSLEPKRVQASFALARKKLEAERRQAEAKAKEAAKTPAPQTQPNPNQNKQQ